MVPLVHHWTLSDRLLHWLLIALGLGLGSFVKTGWDKLAERFWDKEWVEFRKFKAFKDKE